MKSRWVMYWRMAGLAAAMVAAFLLASGAFAQMVDQTLGQVTDVIVGHGGKGPFTLSWTDMDPGSISVVVSGMTLHKDQDYSVDASSGIISFTSALNQDVIARVAYTLVPGKSQRSTAGATVPVTVNVFAGQGAGLQFTGLYSGTDVNNPDTGTTVLGLSGNKKWSSVNLTSQFLVSQTTDSASNPDFWQRSAFKLGEDSTFGALKLSGSFLHSGQSFSGASAFALASGQDVTNLAAVYSPSKTVQAAIKFQDTSAAARAMAAIRASIRRVW